MYYNLEELHDAQFTETLTQMKHRFRGIVGNDAEITLVFDCGNNSLDNLELLESEGLSFHYVGGLKKTKCRSCSVSAKVNTSP